MIIVLRLWQERIITTEHPDVILILLISNQQNDNASDSTLVYDEVFSKSLVEFNPNPFYQNSNKN
jgi:hypothetical protein